MTKCLATLRRFRTLRRLQWKLPGGAVNGWHRHRHRPGPELPVDTANEGWGLLTGHQRGPAPGHTRGLSHGHGHSCAWCGPPVPGKMACRPGDGAAAGSSPNHRGWQPVPDQDHSYSPGAQGGLSATSASVRQRYAPAVGSCSLLSARGIWRPPPHLLWQVLATSWRAAWPDTGLTWRARDSHHQGVASARGTRAHPVRIRARVPQRPSSSEGTYSMMYDLIPPVTVSALIAVLAVVCVVSKDPGRRRRAV